MSDIEQVKIDSISTDTDSLFNDELTNGERRAIVNNVASWTLIAEEIVDKGWIIVGYDGTRAIIESNDSSHDFTIDELISIGREVASELANRNIQVLVNPQRIQ